MPVFIYSEQSSNPAENMDFAASTIEPDEVDDRLRDEVASRILQETIQAGTLLTTGNEDMADSESKVTQYTINVVPNPPVNFVGFQSTDLKDGFRFGTRIHRTNGASATIAVTDGTTNTGYRPIVDFNGQRIAEDYFAESDYSYYFTYNRNRGWFVVGSEVISSPGDANVQADWDQTNQSADSFIRNKPGNATTDDDGLMSSEDKTKLDTVEENAKDDQTPIEIRDSLTSLVGDQRLSALALKDLPSPGTPGGATEQRVLTPRTQANANSLNKVTVDNGEVFATEDKAIAGADAQATYEDYTNSLYDGAHFTAPDPTSASADHWYVNLSHHQPQKIVVDSTFNSKIWRDVTFAELGLSYIGDFPSDNAAKPHVTARLQVFINTDSDKLRQVATFTAPTERHIEYEYHRLAKADEVDALAIALEDQINTLEDRIDDAGDVEYSDIIRVLTSSEVTTNASGTIVLNPTPAVTAYADGMSFQFVPPVGSGSTFYVRVSGQPQRTIRLTNRALPGADAWGTNHPIIITYVSSLGAFISNVDPPITIPPATPEYDNSDNNRRLGLLERRTEDVEFIDYPGWADANDVTDTAFAISPVGVAVPRQALVNLPYAVTQTVSNAGEYNVVLRLAAGREVNQRQVASLGFTNPLRGDWVFTGLTEGAYSYYEWAGRVTLSSTQVLTAQVAAQVEHTLYDGTVSEAAIGRSFDNIRKDTVAPPIGDVIVYPNPLILLTGASNTWRSDIKVLAKVQVPISSSSTYDGVQVVFGGRTFTPSIAGRTFNVGDELDVSLVGIIGYETGDTTGGGNPVSHTYTFENIGNTGTGDGVPSYRVYALELRIMSGATIAYRRRTYVTAIHVDLSQAFSALHHTHTTSAPAAFSPTLVFSGNLADNQKLIFKDAGFNLPNDADWLMGALNIDKISETGTAHLVNEDFRVFRNPRSPLAGVPVNAAAVGDTVVDNNSIGFQANAINVTVYLGRTTTGRALYSASITSKGPNPLVIYKL